MFFDNLPNCAITSFFIFLSLISDSKFITATSIPPFTLIIDISCSLVSTVAFVHNGKEKSTSHICEMLCASSSVLYFSFYKSILLEIKTFYAINDNKNKKSKIHSLANSYKGELASQTVLLFKDIISNKSKKMNRISVMPDLLVYFKQCI